MADKEYIDTRYLFKCETCRHCIGEYKCDTFCDSGECYSPNMTKIPTADVVEVVRCKDCKHFVSEVCRHDFAMNLSRGDDFCSYGERKEQT